VKQHIFSVLSVLFLLAACGNDSATNPGGGGQGNTGGTTSTDCQVCGPSTDDFFDNATVANLRLTFDAADLKGYTDEDHPDGYSTDQWLDLLWAKWNNHCGPYEWIPVRMDYENPDHPDGNVTLEKVAVRLRGTRGRGSNPLQGFKMDFTKALPDGSNRRFAGLSRLNALSNEHDNSNMVQCMSYKLMRDFGLVAPNCNHLRVYVNGTLYGLVESVERGKDARFLKHHYGTSDGSLYAASASCGYLDSLANLQYYGDVYDVPEYTNAYEILRGTPADAEANLIPMLKCGDDTQTPDDEEFKTCIQEWIDVDQWLREIAGESLMPTVEDFVGALRNYFLYFQPDAAAPHGGTMRIWGWDYDTSLQRTICSPSNCEPFTAVAGFYAGSPRGKLVRRLMRVFKDQYCELMNTFLTDVYKPEKVDEMAAVIEPAMMEDPVVAYADWQAEVTKMRAFMVSRKEKAQALVDKACTAE
jgi:spore coat protein H